MNKANGKKYHEVRKIFEYVYYAFIEIYVVSSKYQIRIRFFTQTFPLYDPSNISCAIKKKVAFCLKNYTQVIFFIFYRWECTDLSKKIKVLFPWRTYFILCLLKCIGQKAGYCLTLTSSNKLCIIALVMVS